MDSTARDSYRVTEITTATPQKLRLMLIDGAIRSGLRASAHWRAGENGQAAEALIHAQEIMGELMAGFDPQAQSGLVQRVAGIYAFIYRSLIEAAALRDEAKLAGAIRVLQVERETWRQVCEKLGSVTEGRPDRATFQSPPPPKAPHFPAAAMDSFSSDCRGGFSLEA